MRCDCRSVPSTDNERIWSPLPVSVSFSGWIFFFLTVATLVILSYMLPYRCSSQKSCHDRETNRFLIQSSSFDKEILDVKNSVFNLWTLPMFLLLACTRQTGENASSESTLSFVLYSSSQVGSPSALSDADLNHTLRQAAQKYGRTLYVPSGALWGGQDIQRLNDSGALKVILSGVQIYAASGFTIYILRKWYIFWLTRFQGLFIRMSKHPSCFRLTGDLPSDWMEGEGRRVLYNGSVAELCPLAPNNVNTMAAAAVAAGTLGFNGVRGEIVSDTAWVLPTMFQPTQMQPFISAWVTLFMTSPALG